MTQRVRSGWRFGTKILVPLIAAALVAAAMAGLGLYWATNQSDAVSVERQLHTTQRAIDDSVARLALEQETVAVWDESADQASRPGPDLTWLHDNTGLWLHNVFGHDQTFILNLRDEPIYASDEGRMIPARRFEAMRGEIQILIDETRGRGREPSNRFDRHPGGFPPGSAVLTTERAVHDTQIVRLAGRPAAASVMLMRASTPELRQPGREPVMVTVRYLDREFLAELEHRNLIDQPRFSGRRDPVTGEQALPLESEDGGTIGYIIWRPELPGSQIMAVLGPTTAFSLLGMVLILSVLARSLRRSTGELESTVIQLRASEAQAQHLAFHDTLTGLPNRALFNDRLEHALGLARRGEGLALLLLDLDRFKHVNDTLGHQAGDALIREFATRVSALVRECDTVARLGGDEFAVLLPHLSEQQEVDALCARILGAVDDRFDMLGKSAFVGVSIGTICAPLGGFDRIELMRKADIALYRAKAEGGDCHRAFSEDMDEHVQMRSTIEDDLRAALVTNDQLLVHYQPEMGEDGCSIVGVEALVRWQHPEKGLISPEQFVPIAEETGLICQLGEWVLGEACRAARRWPDLFVAVNLSPVQFRTSGFAERVIHIVRDSGVSAKQIELEVTEGVLLADDDLVHDALRTLRRAGFRIALDDFGTGYSSFSYLRRFEVDKLKIDKSFIQHLGHRVDSATLVSAVVSIGHAMGLTVTAEGVETNAQRRFLAGAGCNQMQGFLFSRALPEEDLARFLACKPEVRAAA